MKTVIAILALLVGLFAPTAVFAASGDRHHLFAILRPTIGGYWEIQNDSTHAPYGIDTYMVQNSWNVQIFPCCVTSYSKVGAISITSDDGFGAHKVTGHANMGTSTITIEIRVDGVLVNPGSICSYITSCNNGNFWIMIDMIE
jgi:hypothetical protein